MRKDFDLVFMLGHLDAAVASIHGLEHKIHGLTDEERAILEPKIQKAQTSLAEAIHTLIGILPEEARSNGVRKGNA